MPRITVDLDEHTMGVLRWWARHCGEEPTQVVTRLLSRMHAMALLYDTNPQVEADANRLMATITRADERHTRQEGRR